MVGRRVQVRRPRARGANGHEVVLPTWSAYAAEDPLPERALAQMLIGVSTRRYDGSLEAVPEGVTTRPTSAEILTVHRGWHSRTGMLRWQTSSCADRQQSMAELRLRALEREHSTPGAAQSR